MMKKILMMKLLEKAKNPDFWRNIRSDENYAPIIAWIKKLYAEERKFPLPPLTERLRALFAETGSRAEFEKPYFGRRRFLTAAALLALLYPEEERYLDETQQILELISDESAWALPAHTYGMNEEESAVFIDLFAAETGLQSPVRISSKGYFDPSLKSKPLPHTEKFFMLSKNLYLLGRLRAPDGRIRFRLQKSDGAADSVKTPSSLQGLRRNRRR